MDLYYTNRKTSSLSNMSNGSANQSWTGAPGERLLWELLGTTVIWAGKAFRSPRFTFTTAVRGTVGHIAPDISFNRSILGKLMFLDLEFCFLKLITGQRSLRIWKAANQKEPC
uniref:Uncharacterized protein n=1 Tax=Salix viminalis TaxID=40686 RepID=A0A6N2NCP9_SALVM